MKKTRKLHLWIGLIASVFIFLEALTGLLLNEPWLIGQSQVESGKGNFPAGMMRGSGQEAGQNQGELGGQQQGEADGQMQGRPNAPTQGQAGANGNGQFQPPSGFGGNVNFAGRTRGEGMGQGSLVSTIRNLHEGRIGNTDVKWLVDLVAIAMMVLTGTGIYLSLKILGAGRKRKKRQEENFEVM